MTLELRPYQREAAMAFGRLLLENPLARGIVVLPTGTGKTKLGLSIANGLGRTLWLAHTEELVEQPYENFRALFPGKEAGIVKAGRDLVGAKDFVVASIQTLARPDRLERLLSHQAESGAFKFVVGDEGHHVTKGSVYERVFDAVQAPTMLLTATPERADGRPIGAVAHDGVIYRYPISVAIAEGWLVNVTDGTTPGKSRRIKVNLEGVNLDDAEAVDKRLMEEHSEIHVVNAACEAVALGRKPLAFVTSVALAARCAEVARERGVAATHVSADTPAAERKQALRDYAAGKIRALFNFAVFLEGVDIPSIDALIWARPTRSKNVYQQGVGRALRPSPLTGKVDCLLYDLVGAHSVHGLVTGDQVFGQDEKPAPSLPQAPDLEAKPDDTAEAKRLRRFLLYLSGKLELEGQTTEATVKWLVAVRGECMVMSAGDDGMVLVERARGEDMWQAVLEPKGKESAAVALCEPTSLDLAQTIGENHARGCGGFRLSAKDARWRRNDASTGQVRALSAWRIDVPGRLTSGQASDLLDMAAGAARYRSRGKRPALMSARAAPTFFNDL